MNRNWLRLATVFSLATLIYLFVAHSSWMMARPISELNQYETKPVIPEGSVTFSSNHGDFVFYADSPDTNEPKFLAIIFAGAICTLFLIIAGLWEVAVASPKSQ